VDMIAIVSAACSLLSQCKRLAMYLIGTSLLSMVSPNSWYREPERLWTPRLTRALHSTSRRHQLWPRFSSDIICRRLLSAAIFFYNP
jgi:hypothetical protein